MSTVDSVVLSYYVSHRIHKRKSFTVRWIVEIVLCNAVIGSRLEAKFFDLAVRILEPYESWIIVRYDTLIIENLVVR